MINWWRRATTLSALLAMLSLVAVAPAFSQAPTQAQRDAIKSKCRSDYIAHCSSIPPGGEASLQCLQKNMSSLAPGCQTAVRAVEAPAEPKADAKPNSAPAATTTAKPAEPAATAPNTATSKATTPKSAAPKPAAANPGEPRTCCACASANAAPRGTPGVEVGMRRRRSLTVRRARARRWSYRALSGNTGCFALTGMQGRPGPVRRAMKLFHSRSWAVRTEALRRTRVRR